MNPGHRVHPKPFRVVPNGYVDAAFVRAVAVQAPQAPFGRPHPLQIVEHVGIFYLANPDRVGNLAARRRGEAAAHRIQLRIVPFGVPAVPSIGNEIHIPRARIGHRIKKILKIPPQKKQRILPRFDRRRQTLRYPHQLRRLCLANTR